jgi:hypothetical protein
MVTRKLKKIKGRLIKPEEAGEGYSSEIHASLRNALDLPNNLLYGLREVDQQQAKRLMGAF